MIIDPKSISNGWSVHELLTAVAPAINRLGDRVQQLEAEVKSLRDQAPKPGPAAAAAPASYADTEVALGDPIILPGRSPAGVKRARR